MIKFIKWLCFSDLAKAKSGHFNLLPMLEWKLELNKQNGGDFSRSTVLDSSFAQFQAH